MPSDHRLHPLSIAFGLGAQLREFAWPAVALLVGARSTGAPWESWILLALIPYTLLSVARYVSFRYRFDEGEMVIRTGILFRNERHVPYARIQNLEATENLLHRLGGVVEVRLDTGGGQEPEATMRVLAKGAFEEMRRRVLEERGAAGPREDAATAPLSRTLLTLPPRELVLYGLIENRGLVLVGAAMGLAWEFAWGDRMTWWQRGGERTDRNAVRELVREWTSGIELPFDLASRVVLGVLAVIAFLLLTRALSVVWALVRLHGFTLARWGEDLRMQYGLLTRVATAIPLRRIQTLTMRESVLHRWAGRASVRVDTAGGGAGGSGRTERAWLAPIIVSGEVPALVRHVLPELDLDAVQWQPAAPGAFRRAIKVPLLLVGLLTLFLVPSKGVFALAALPVLLPLAAAVTHLHVRHLGWAVTEAAVLFRSGWLLRQVSVARFAKIQAVALDESPFDRRAGMARVRVDTAGAGDRSHRVAIPYLPRDTAESLCATLGAAAARTEFQW
ncbi:MAG: PH domain-containing protein [Vicinamibacterales bacterium]|nr:PH domain-containing protein [Vicinamibacterales bacterium]